MKKILLLVLWIVHAILYVFRDFTFVNINYEIKFLQASKGSRFELYNYTHSFIEQFVSGMNVSELNQLKWILTFVFSSFFLGLSILLLKLITDNWKKALQFSIMFYGVIFIVSALLYITAGYSVSRELMIIPQSPIASIILFISVKIFKK